MKLLSCFLMDYYKQIQYLAEVDKNDNILGKIEKWQAHKNNVPHRGYTVILYYKNQIILQHRKHPVFDKVYDLSFSSHQVYINGELQNDVSAIYEGLKREWILDKNDLAQSPKFITKFYYRAHDPNSEYFEHEIDYLYKVKLKKLPQPNLEYAYGMEVIDQSEIKTLPKLFPNLAPWLIKEIDILNEMYFS